MWKIKECNGLKDDIERMQRQLDEKAKVYGQNRDLVTKNCGLQSNV